MQKLQATFDKLLRETSTKFHRYMYHKINWDARMIGIVGPRGIGKRHWYYNISRRICHERSHFMCKLKTFILYRIV